MAITQTNYDVASFWSDVAGEIAARKSNNYVASDDTPYTRHKREKFLHKWIRNLPVAGQVVLEVGCGPGGVITELARLSPAKILGVDISDKMISLARKNLDQHNTYIELFHTNGVELPFEDDSIDICVLSTVLMHNKDRDSVRKMVAEVCRVTRKTVFIFEETSMTFKEQFAHEKRPSEFYRTVFGENGFDMSSREYLNTELSRICCGSLDRVILGNQRGKGKPIPSVSRFIQALLIAITKHIDNIIRMKQGLTKMVFPSR